MSGALGPGTLRFESLVLDITMDLINAGSTLAELRNSDRQFVCLRCNEGDQRPLGFAALLQHIVYPPKYRYSHGPLRPRYKWDIDRVWYRTLTPSEAHDLQEEYERLRSPNVSSVGDYWLGGFMEEDLDSDDPVEARMRRLNAASSNTRD
ncbi:hypothetical protein FRC03_012684 [Tulasnella sp. 419]|nr:hypothetical protein FRC03_012684 [Tulasnella sp. 419]